MKPVPLVLEALSLLNREEHIEALGVLRQLHGMVNRFQCSECNHIMNTWDGLCCMCTSDKHKTVVVIEVPE